MTEEQRLEKNNNIKKSMKETYLRRMSQICKVFTVKIDESRLTAKQKEVKKTISSQDKSLCFCEADDLHCQYYYDIFMV